MIVDGIDKKIVIIDNNYKWLQVAFNNQNFWLTVMYDDKDNLIELYFDITKKNVFLDNANLYCYDMFLDIVITNNGNVHILDKDELDMALMESVITKYEYELAYNIGNSLYNYILKYKKEIIEESNKQFLRMIKKLNSI